MGAFLAQAGFAERITQWRTNTASEATFQQRFSRWFDRFQVLKFAHHARATAHPEQPVPQSAAALLRRIGRTQNKSHLPEELLKIFRELESGRAK